MKSSVFPVSSWYGDAVSKDRANILQAAMWNLLLMVVAVISVHDAALVVVNKEIILEYEQNPLGAYLIQLNNGSVWLFVGVKLIGTSLVCAIMASVYQFSKGLAMAITGPLAAFQASLLIYLYCN